MKIFFAIFIARFTAFLIWLGALSLKTLSVLNPFSSREKIFFTGLFLSLLISFPFIIFSQISASYQNKIYSDVNSIPENNTALVLGAAVWQGNVPSHILSDRVHAAVSLYKAGKVKKLIMSGDNRFKDYDEPTVMMDLAKKLGVPENDLQPDFAGRRTYDSCWRAKNIFSQDKLTVVTNDFHIIRSLFLCSNIGIDTIGFTADQNKTQYSEANWNYWAFRDKIALTKSLIDLFIVSPYVVEGDKIQLP